MRLHRSTRRSRGFTLIESISAVVVLAVAIPPMLWALRQAHVQRVNPMMSSKARWLVTEKLEDIIADRHSETRGFGYLTTANYPAENPVAGFPGFSRTVGFLQLGPDLAPGTGYMRATVTVTWTDSTGTSRSLALVSIVTEY